TLTTPGKVTVAVRFVSQLAGPEKWTTLGFGTALVTLQPGPARAITDTGRSLATSVSTVTTIGAGLITVTAVIVDRAVTFSLTDAPAWVGASTVAVKLLAVTFLMSPARPL